MELALVGHFWIVQQQDSDWVLLGSHVGDYRAVDLEVVSLVTCVLETYFVGRHCKELDVVASFEVVETSDVGTDLNTSFDVLDKDETLDTA